MMIPIAMPFSALRALRKRQQSDNPYAQTASDQYTEDNTKFAGQSIQSGPLYVAESITDSGSSGMTKYQQAREGQGLNRYDSSASSATAPPPYSNQEAPSGYGNNRYGASGGYASNNKYAGSSYSSAPRQGGYGGLGRTDSTDTVRSHTVPAVGQMRPDVNKC